MRNVNEVVKKPWGSYEVLTKGYNYKVKTLTIQPGKTLSDQRHFKRNEHWFILMGELTLGNQIYKQNDVIDIPVKQWHQPSNKGIIPCIVCEIQYGGECIEEDIERTE